jgi:hypothetical protein
MKGEPVSWLGEVLPGLHLPDLLLAFFSLLLEGVPFLLLGAMLSGLVDIGLSPDWVRRFLPRKKGVAVLVAGAAGFAFPLCECAGLPVIARLIRKGVPVSAAVMYLVASPMVNPLTLMSTWLAFSGQSPWSMMGLRLGFSVMILAFLGWWMSRLKPETIVRSEILTGTVDPQPGLAGAFVRPGSSRGPGLARAKQFVGTVVDDFLGVLFYFIIGAAVATLFSVAVNRALLAPVGQHVLAGPIIGVALAQSLCLCSTSDAFVAAALGFLSSAAKLAFMTSGPILDLKLAWMYQVMLRREFVVALWFRTTLAVLALSWLYGLFG